MSSETVLLPHDAIKWIFHSRPSSTIATRKLLEKVRCMIPTCRVSRTRRGTSSSHERRPHGSIFADLCEIGAGNTEAAARRLQDFTDYVTSVRTRRSMREVTAERLDAARIAGPPVNSTHQQPD